MADVSSAEFARYASLVAAGERSAVQAMALTLLLIVVILIVLYVALVDERKEDR